MKYKVTINREGCKGCEICMKWCGKNLIEEDKDYLNESGIHPAVVKKQDECVGCLNCAIMCPDAVITIESL